MPDSPRIDKGAPIVEREPTALFRPVAPGSHDSDLLADFGHHLAFELCECRVIALCRGRNYTRKQDQCRRYARTGHEPGRETRLVHRSTLILASASPSHCFLVREGGSGRWLAASFSWWSRPSGLRYTCFPFPASAAEVTLDHSSSRSNIRIHLFCHCQCAPEKEPLSG